MKKALLLLIVFLGFGLHIQAQELSVADTLLVFDGNDESVFELVGHTELTNNTNQTQTYVWVREIIEQPDGWNNAVCDINQCYFHTVSTAEFDLMAGESGLLDVHVRPFGIAGKAIVKLTVTDVDNPDVSICVQYESTIGTVSIDNLIQQDVQIFPNPTSNVFVMTENSIVEELTVFNIIGRPIRTFKARNGQQYDVRDLATGLYLVRMTDKDGKIIKTVRMTKH